MEEVINGILIREVETKNIMTKSSLPVGGYSVNPYVGCTHACKYCYASFMKRFTGHKEEWGTFLDVKHWPEIKNPKKYAGQRVVIGSVTDGYNPQEEQFGNTRKLLEQLIGSDADILICTKSDLVVRDIDLLKKLGRVTVSWSINTLDENFKNDMDSASSIERRISAMKQVYEAGIRTVCFVSPVFPGITDFEAIFERVKDQCDLFWLENLNLRGGFKKTIMDYIAGKYPDLVPLYDEVDGQVDRHPQAEDGDHDFGGQGALFHGLVPFSFWGGSPEAPFWFLGQGAPLRGGVPFCSCRKEPKDTHRGFPPMYPLFFLGIRGGGVTGLWGSGLAAPPLVLPLVCRYWGVGGSLG